MKININDRSTKELFRLMEHYGIQSPAHMVQTMITQLNKSIPTVEDTNGNIKKTAKTL